MFLVIGVYAVCVFIFILQVLSMTMSLAETGILGAVFLAIPLYAQYGNSKYFKLRVFDEKKLIFSSDGIHFGEDNYPLIGLEAAAVYLDSFDGFMFRDLSITGGNHKAQVVGRKMDGDNNKISIRFNGEIEDFTFYLENYEKYALFQAVLRDWSASGVNVVLKLTFSDEYMEEQMRFFGMSRTVS